MKVHYDCFTDPEEEPAPSCRVSWGEEIETTSNWGDVTCKRCLHRKKKTMKLLLGKENLGWLLSQSSPRLIVPRVMLAWI